jgi:hypothetical protein
MNNNVLEVASSDSNEMECPICFDTVSDDNLRFPFECGHHLCARCDERMFTIGNDRCPSCRCARTPGSINELMVQISPDAINERIIALATNNRLQRLELRDSNSVPGVIFFAAHPSSGINVTYTVCVRFTRTQQISNTSAQNCPF